MATEWMFDGLQAYYEFQEKKTSTALGSIVSQQIQRRKVWQFKRHRIELITAPATFAQVHLGTADVGINVKAKLGDHFVTGSASIVGGKRQWVCTQEDCNPDAAHCDWFVREEAWEMREAWVDWDWPEP